MKAWMSMLACWALLSAPYSLEAGAPAHPQPGAALHESWGASWAAAPVFAIGPEIGYQTIRQTIRLSAGGNRIRVRFTNENNANTLVIGAAHLALPGSTLGAIDPTTDRTLTFNGQGSVSVPAGAPMYSDPLELDTAPLSTLSVSIFIERYSGPSTIHPDGNSTTFISGEGDFTGVATIAGATTTPSRFFLSEVDVATVAKSTATIVTLGDSITDGANSTIDASHRWPDRLAERLLRSPQAARIGIANAGISGNRILHDMPEASFGPSALARLDRDVLSKPGLRWVILMEGINDIGHSTSGRLPEQDVSAEEIIAGMRQIIVRVTGQGAKIIGATLTPFEGTSYSGFYSSGGEAKRQAVNHWIRSGNAFDAVIDFDAVLRDPQHPGRIRPELDSGDHIHPNDDGYTRMAVAIDLSLFQ